MLYMFQSFLAASLWWDFHKSPMEDRVAFSEQQQGENPKPEVLPFSHVESFSGWTLQIKQGPLL